MRPKGERTWVLLLAVLLGLLLLPAGSVLAQVHDYVAAPRVQGGVAPGVLANGDFETGDLTGWRTDYNWSGGQGPAPGHVWEVRVGPEYAHSGKFGCRVYNANNPSWSGAWLISKDFTDTSAGYSMWLKLAGGCTTYWSGVVIGIVDVASGKEIRYEGNVSGNAWHHGHTIHGYFTLTPGEWQECRFDFVKDFEKKYGTAPGGVRRIYVNAYQDTDFCDVYVDDIKGYGGAEEGRAVTVEGTLQRGVEYRFRLNQYVLLPYPGYEGEYRKLDNYLGRQVRVSGYAYPGEVTLGGEGVVLKVTAVSGPGPVAALPVIFRVGQAEREVGGQRFVMDVAPYIKDGRSYVPVRFLAYALGVPEEGVQWDGAAKAVTLRRGDVVLRLTLGSSLMERRAGEGPTVSLVMDVAPEPRFDRVFLPARYVAAGLGYGAAWDPAAEQVTLAPDAIAWPEELVFEPNPVEPEGALGILVRISGPETQPVVRLKGVGGPGEPEGYWRQTDRVTLNPAGPGKWGVGCMGPGRAGIYPAEVVLGGLTFTAGDWLLRVYPAGWQDEPGFASPEEAVSARFARDFPGCTLREIRMRDLLPDDPRDPRYHRLLTVTFYQPYAGPVLPAGTHTYCYYVVRDGPAGPWRVLAGGTGP